MTPRLSFLSLVLLFFLTSCSPLSLRKDSDPLETEFYSYDLLIDDNAGLAHDVIGRQLANQIILEYPDIVLPGFHWVPRFSTDAVSVEVDGIPQSSGQSLVDFSNPVSYTLTAGSGKVQQFDVILKQQPGWQDLGANPVLPGMFSSVIRTGFLHDSNPFVVCLDSANFLRAYAFDLIDSSSWGEFFGGPNGVVTFDTIAWKKQIWSVYQNGTSITAQSCVAPNAWSGVLPLTGLTGSISGLHFLNGSNKNLFAAWIDDSANSKNPVVWVYDTVLWQAVGSSVIPDEAPYNTMPVPLHAKSFKAVSDGGATLYAACIFDEAPGLIHLFQYNELSNAWTSLSYETELLWGDKSRIIVDMFYDSDKKAPVIFTRSKNYNINNSYTINALYYDDLAAVWTNLNYIDAFYIPESDYTSLSISWYNNSPSAVYGNNVINWTGTSWMRIGQNHYTSAPSVQSLSRTVKDRYITALRDDSTGDLIMRFYQ